MLLSKKGGKSGKPTIAQIQHPAWGTNDRLGTNGRLGSNDGWGTND